MIVIRRASSPTQRAQPETSNENDHQSCVPRLWNLRDRRFEGDGYIAVAAVGAGGGNRISERRVEIRGTAIATGEDSAASAAAVAATPSTRLSPGGLDPSTTTASKAPVASVISCAAGERIGIIAASGASAALETAAAILTISIETRATASTAGAPRGAALAATRNARLATLSVNPVATAAAASNHERHGTRRQDEAATAAPTSIKREAPSAHRYVQDFAGSEKNVAAKKSA